MKKGMGVWLLAIGMIFALPSCKSEPKQVLVNIKPEEKIGEYTDTELGWTMPLPDGWSIQPQEDILAGEAKGRQTMEGLSGESIDVAQLKHLLFMEKDQFNQFRSTSEPSPPSVAGDYELAIEDMKSLLQRSFVSQGINCDTTVTIVENIGGVDFYTFSMNVYTPEGDLMFSQIMYSALRNGKDFGVSIIYNSDATRDEILGAWRKSVFK